MSSLACFSFYSLKFHPLKMDASTYKQTQFLSSSTFFHPKPLSSKLPRRVCKYSFNNGSFRLKHSGIRIMCSGSEQVNEVEEQKQKKAYPFHEIEPKWQRYWENNLTFQTPDDIDTSKPKFYVLDMFPYPRSLFIFLYLCFFNSN